MENKNIAYILTIILIIFLLFGISFFYISWKDHKKNRDEISRLNDELKSLQYESEILKNNMGLITSGFDMQNNIQNEADLEEPHNNQTNDYADNSEESKEFKQMYTAPPSFLPNSYNILAIGNCITRNNNSIYSPYEYGLGASSFEGDYIHQLGMMMGKKQNGVYVYPVNYSLWENEVSDTAGLLWQLDSYFNDEIDLVVIQLGENVSNLVHFEKDLNDLIKYVKEKAPNAQIVVVDDFWSDEKSEIKEKVVKDNNVLFASLDEIRGDNDYQCGMGYETVFTDGSKFNIDNSNAAEYPNNKAMNYIAKSIYDLIETN